MREEHVPKSDWILGLIEEIFSKGVRRPGYPADRDTIELTVEKFQSFGLEKVRKEPVSLPYWEPRSSSLHITASGGSFELPCFPLPHTAPADGLELELAAYDPALSGAITGKASFHESELLRIPPTGPVGGGIDVEDGAAASGIALRPGGRIIDPRGTFKGAIQVLPFGPLIQSVMEPALAGGASAYIGSLTAYPGDSYQYYVPYDGIERPIPGLWIRGSDGARLRAALAEGKVHVKIHVDSIREEITDHNVIGELPGASEETVVIGSHHDGPWSSAVEDSSGMALLLAQAKYWSAIPQAERPHRLLFLANAGHMAGGAGCHAFLDAHASELDSIVLAIHLEHAANEFTEKDGELVPTGEPETRWFFTSRNPTLENAVADALQAEGLDRSLILPPDAFGERPSTDGGDFHLKGVPLVNYLTAPFYLFDPMDTMDKIHVPSLEPITRAAIRIVNSTKGVTAAEMRAGIAG